VSEREERAMAAEETTEGSAPLHGPLWGRRARDWAELQEPLQRPLYEAGLRLTGIGPGASVLDVGCGCGLFCRLAADTGASVSGIDASAPSIEIAKERVPDGEFQVGDLQFLPYADGRFDVVTGFNSFQFAADPRAALAGAGRVAKPGAPVFVLVWGREERTELVAVLEALRPLLPPAPPGAPGPFALSHEGALEELVAAAGLTPRKSGYLDATFEYRDEETAVRAALSSGAGARAIAEAGEDAARQALAEHVRPFRRGDGAYRLETEWRYLVASA
jgi:SAM-dependent methyltransferase